MASVQAVNCEKSTSLSFPTSGISLALPGILHETVLLGIEPWRIWSWCTEPHQIDLIYRYTGIGCIGQILVPCCHQNRCSPKMVIKMVTEVLTHPEMSLAIPHAASSPAMVVRKLETLRQSYGLLGAQFASRNTSTIINAPCIALYRLLINKQTIQQ